MNSGIKFFKSNLSSLQRISKLVEMPVRYHRKIKLANDIGIIKSDIRPKTTFKLDTNDEMVAFWKSSVLKMPSFYEQSCNKTCQHLTDHVNKTCKKQEQPPPKWRFSKNEGKNKLVNFCMEKTIAIY